ncbi:hypothetical protein GCM10009525_29920 [Streptosporangium amethystogenes subsp. fukuiense]
MGLDEVEHVGSERPTPGRRCRKSRETLGHWPDEPVGGGAVSLWLNTGVHAPEAAERAEHGVDVLLKVYAKCIDGQREVANQRILAALTV